MIKKFKGLSRLEEFFLPSWIQTIGKLGIVHATELLREVLTEVPVNIYVFLRVEKEDIDHKNPYLEMWAKYFNLCLPEVDFDKIPYEYICKQIKNFESLSAGSSEITELVTRLKALKEVMEVQQDS